MGHQRLEDRRLDRAADRELAALIETAASGLGDAQRGETGAVVGLQQLLLIRTTAGAVGVEVAKQAGQLIAVDQQAQAAFLLDLQLLCQRLGGEVRHHQMDRPGLGCALVGLDAAVLLLPVPVGVLVLAGQVQAQLLDGVQHQQA